VGTGQGTIWRPPVLIGNEEGSFSSITAQNIYLLIVINSKRRSGIHNLKIILIFNYFSKYTTLAFILSRVQGSVTNNNYFWIG
jgi:hypothetical protein